MKLFYFETPNSHKPCAVARYLDSPVEFVRVDLAKGEHRTPAFLDVNPNGKVPALRDGDVRVWEGPAIMVYLAQRAGSDLWPGEPARQVEVLQWLNWDTAHFARHAGSLFFENYIKAAFAMGEPDAAAIEEATKFFLQFATVLDQHLAGRAYILGDALTVTDFAVAAELPYADKAKLPLDGFAEIARWHASLMQMPAWRDPFPAAP